MYGSGSGNTNTGNVSGEGSNLAGQQLQSKPAAHNEGGVMRQIMNPGGDKYDDTRYGNTATTTGTSSTGGNTLGSGNEFASNKDSDATSASSIKSGIVGVPSHSRADDILAEANVGTSSGLTGRNTDTLGSNTATGTSSGLTGRNTDTLGSNTATGTSGGLTGRNTDTLGSNTATGTSGGLTGRNTDTLGSNTASTTGTHGVGSTRYVKQLTSSLTLLMLS